MGLYFINLPSEMNEMEQLQALVLAQQRIIAEHDRERNQHIRDYRRLMRKYDFITRDSDFDFEPVECCGCAEWCEHKNALFCDNCGAYCASCAPTMSLACDPSDESRCCCKWAARWYCSCQICRKSQ